MSIEIGRNNNDNEGFDALAAYHLNRKYHGPLMSAIVRALEAINNASIRAKHGSEDILHEAQANLSEILQTPGAKIIHRALIELFPEKVEG